MSEAVRNLVVAATDAATEARQCQEALAQARQRQKGARLALYDAVGATEAARLLGITRVGVYRSISNAP